MTRESDKERQREFLRGLDTIESNFLGSYSTADAGHTVFNNELAAGSYISYNGTIYRYDGARWLDLGGIGGNIPITFSLDPFANAEPAEWGKPFPIWANGARGGATPYAMAYHVRQRKMLQITALMEFNSDLEIPLIDADGNAWIDPAIPPCSYLRWNSDSTNDRVLDVGNVANLWSDRNTAVRGYPGNNDSATVNELETRCFSHLFRIEKTPNPHWVLRISYSWNRLTSAVGTIPLLSDLRTVLVTCIGSAASTHVGDNIDAGSPGVAGHYRVKSVFSQFGENQVAADHTRFEEAVLAHDDGSLAPGAVATDFLFTDTGLAGGTSLFSISNAPFVRFYGDLYQWGTFGGAEQQWVATSLGAGCLSDGLWQGHDDPAGNPLSIQHPDYDQFINESILKRAAAGYWWVSLHSRVGTVNAAGQTIYDGPAGTPTRHVQVHSFGKGP